MTAAHRVLIVHNSYQQRGGEDSVVESELDLLREHGHAVQLYARHNDEVTGASAVSLAAQTLWSRHSQRALSDQILAFKPNVIHVHNTWPLISPSVYWTASRHHVPVVQSLHNFRLMCPQAMFLREGRVCEDCLGQLPWRGVVRGCYRDSTVQTAALAATVTLHRAMGTYGNKVARFIALNEFCRQKFIEGGLPADKICIKPNFVNDPGLQPEVGVRTGGLFVGRLSVDKGVQVLLQAQALAGSSIKVAGVGDLLPAVQTQLGAAALGFMSGPAVLDHMRHASYLVMPSLWYENFPRTLVEAFSCGLPVIGSRIGALAELIEDGKTGLLFKPGDAHDLAAKMQWAQANPGAMLAMGRHARALYERAYGPESNYDRLIEIYNEAVLSVG